MLIHHCGITNHPLFFTASKGSYDIRSIREALSEKQRRYLLLCHAFTGCDTVSAISGHGKTYKFCAGEIDKHLDVFTVPDCTKSGTWCMVYVLENCNTTSDHSIPSSPKILRSHVLSEGSCWKPETLPGWGVPPKLSSGLSARFFTADISVSATLTTSSSPVLHLGASAASPIVTSRRTRHCHQRDNECVRCIILGRLVASDSLRTGRPRFPTLKRFSNFYRRFITRDAAILHPLNSRS